MSLREVRLKMRPGAAVEVTLANLLFPATVVAVSRWPQWGLWGTIPPLLCAYAAVAFLMRLRRERRAAPTFKMRISAPANDDKTMLASMLSWASIVVAIPGNDIVAISLGIGILLVLLLFAFFTSWILVNPWLMVARLHVHSGNIKGSQVTVIGRPKSLSTAKRYPLVRLGPTIYLIADLHERATTTDPTQ